MGLFAIWVHRGLPKAPEDAYERWHPLTEKLYIPGRNICKKDEPVKMSFVIFPPFMSLHFPPFMDKAFRLGYC